jgi:uncharacterized protein YcfL
MQRCKEENSAICVHLCASVVEVITRIYWYEAQRRRDAEMQRGKQRNLCASVVEVITRIYWYEAQRRRDAEMQRGKQRNLCASVCICGRRTDPNGV